MRLRRRAWVVLVSVLTASVLAVPSLVVPSPAGATRGGTLKLLGRLREPSVCAKAAFRSIVQIDPASRRLYYLCYGPQDPEAHLTEFDLAKALPKPLRTANVVPTDELPSTISPYTAALDHRRHRLLLLASGSVGSEIYIIDLHTLRRVGVWDLNRTLPGFAVLGLTYSPRDDRLYLIGELSGSTGVSASTSGVGVKPLGPGTSVVALDGRKGKLLWTRPVPQCQQVMLSYTAGALIARSEHRPALYFFCSTGGATFVNPFPGEAGLVRLTISRTNDEQLALKFPVEFFPISGSYSEGLGVSGIAAFDPTTERFFTQSLASATPGTWVFDGRLSAWVGFVAAPDDDDHYLGLDPVTGHFYMGGDGSSSASGKGWLLVTDARITPVPQGVSYHYTPLAFIPVDPRTRRLFVEVDLGTLGGHAGEDRYVVIKDETPETRQPRPLDYDAQTANVPEGPHTFTTFAGDVNGFGVRATLVGGLGGVLSGSGDALEGSSTGLNLGDRGWMAARVSSLDLREVGASAAAQAAVADRASDTDRGGVQQQLQATGATQVSDLLNWPWDPATCLDSGGGVAPQHKSAPGGDARTKCDLSKPSAEASASFGGFLAEFPGAEVSVASASFQTIATRDPVRGVLTRSTSTARGIDISFQNGGELSIGKVVSAAGTKAHGRPGTSAATWSRLIEDVVVRDASGKPVAQFSKCTTEAGGAHGRAKAGRDDCKQMARTINRELGTRIRFDLPFPEVTATPQGAFAGVQQDEASYLQGQTVYGQGTAFQDEGLSQRAVPAVQIAVFNDSAGQSRLLLQLAAIEASSIYTISPIPTGGNVPVGGSGIGGGGPGGVRPGVSRGHQPGAGGPTGIGGQQENIGQGTAGSATVVGVLIRSVKEALLVAGLWILFLGAVASVMRRRNLLANLQGRSPGGERR